MGYSEELDNEEHPRNAAAIRTALLLGAEFVQLSSGQLGPQEPRNWFIPGINVGGTSKTMCAFLYLVTHGICISKDAKAALCSEMKVEDR